jgi:geranylgeranyl diphosphate synthase type 3
MKVNLASVEYHTSKSFCEDLTEGKFSFPIIHAIRTCPSDHQLLNILKQRTESKDGKKYAVEHRERCG